ncbi:unnamed protein product, partial [Chrysoparadoxa australica]
PVPEREEQASGRPMEAYSPPLTRLRARALSEAQVGAGGHGLSFAARGVARALSATEVTNHTKKAHSSLPLMEIKINEITDISEGKRGVGKGAGQSPRRPNSKEQQQDTGPAAAEAEGDSDRVKGKSVEVKRTGTSPLLKRNRTEKLELKLSKEETMMRGAPQGTIYQVDVLNSSQFTASHDAAEELGCILGSANTGISTGDDEQLGWAEQYTCIDSIRRLAIFHSDMLKKEGAIRIILGVVSDAIMNLRSSTMRNGLLCMQDLFTSLGSWMDPAWVEPQLGNALDAMLSRSGSDKRFIVETAVQALETAAQKGPALLVIRGMMAGIESKNPAVACKAVAITELCLGSLGVGSKADSGLPEGLELRTLLPFLSLSMLKGKLPECRSVARRGLLRSRKALGPAAFERELRQHLSAAEAENVLRTIAAGKKGAGSKGHKSRPSVRDAMRAARRAHSDAATVAPSLVQTAGVGLPMPT